MNLSIWHCLVLYACSQVCIHKLAVLSGLSETLLSRAKTVEKWDLKRAQFLKLNPKQQSSLDILELLFGEFQDDDVKRTFVEKVISRGQVQKSTKTDTAKIIQQKINQLIEFGMNHEQASAFVEEVQSISGKRSKISEDDFADIIPEKLSIQDKLDIVNYTYKYLTYD